MLIKCVPLGAGQDVGKSCVIVTIGGKNIMFDCGMHMGYQDERRYPKFSFVSKTGNYTQAISCVIITHFHLDHIGALPYFTEVCGYEGPIYMTYPTKALAPLMLEDYRKVLVDKKGEQELFSVAQIHQCMKRGLVWNLRLSPLVSVIGQYVSSQDNFYASNSHYAMLTAIPASLIRNMEFPRLLKVFLSRTCGFSFIALCKDSLNELYRHKIIASDRRRFNLVTAVDLKQTVRVDSELEIRAYYAGHVSIVDDNSITEVSGDTVEFSSYICSREWTAMMNVSRFDVLGAAMFYVKVGDDSCVYTGDYNMTPDRHLGAAQIDALQPDLLITESTYATTVRDSKRAREREFLKKVHNCVAGGGKVLIPVFALGRAQSGHRVLAVLVFKPDTDQELCILLDEYWERMNLKYPIYFSAGLTTQANVYYKLLISWTNQKVKDTYVSRNTFDFKHALKQESHDRAISNILVHADIVIAAIDAPGPCVLFATPGMLSGGLSLEVFKHWAPSELNLVVVPGFCLAGTVGNKLTAGKATKLDIDRRSPLDVRCQVHQLSFSAHTDAKGIMDLVKHVSPRNVVLVHGEKPKMASLKAKIIADLGIPCYDPANYETVEVSSRCAVRISVSKAFVRTSMLCEERSMDPMVPMRAENALELPHSREKTAVEGVVILDETSKLKIIQTTEAPTVLNVRQHDMTFTCVCSILVDITDGEVEEESRLQVFHAIGTDIKKDTSPQPHGKAQCGNGSNARGGPQLHFENEGDEVVSRKKYRMDVKRCLSLNLEREPEIEDGDELESHEQQEVLKGPMSFAGDMKRKVPGIGISRKLDINAVPESSSEMEMESAAREPSPPSPLGPPSVPAVLHALFVGLNHLSKSRCMVLEGECLKSRSFSLTVSSGTPADPLYCKEAVGQGPRGSGSRGAKVDKSLVFSAHCSWCFEDDSLANRILDILRRCKLKIF